jgi:hypothetical protein
MQKPASTCCLTCVCCRHFGAELVASGDPSWRAGGWVIFVVCCCGFLLGGGYIVYRSVHRKASRQACFAVFNADDVVSGHPLMTALSTSSFTAPFWL